MQKIHANDENKQIRANEKINKKQNFKSYEKVISTLLSVIWLVNTKEVGFYLVGIYKRGRKWKKAYAKQDLNT